MLFGAPVEPRHQAVQIGVGAASAPFITYTVLMVPNPRIVVVGLGYVGLPLAVALARKLDVTGYDIDRVLRRVAIFLG